MRRALLILLLVGAVVALLIVAPFSSGDQGYLIRAYFDNGGFVVKGEQVRVAGATVGSVDSVDVSMPGEAVNANGSDTPGKAVVVLKITDPGFQDFRTDASCIIRPQSLLGEKFVDCTPTEPRAPGTSAPAPLTVIKQGEPGAGQRFLPLQNNGKQVDLDIVQDTLRLPYAQRFRLILNNLGIGLAARGQDLNAIIRRADPALRETDQVLAILAKQNRNLAQLAKDSETVLAPLARERTHISGFIANAGVSGTATAERSAALEAGLQKFPAFLSELRSTMVQLRSFSEQATPVASNLFTAAPSLTTLTKRTPPFANSTEVALKSLGDNTALAAQPLADSLPVVKQLTKLAKASKSPAKNLNKLLGSLRKTKGYQALLNFIYNTAGVANGFDQYGHFLRSELLVTPCVDYVTAPTSGCGADFSKQQSKIARSLKLHRLAAQASRKAARKAKSTRPGNGGTGVGASKALLDFLLRSGGTNPGTANSGSPATKPAPQTAPGATAPSPAPGYSTGPDPRGVGK